MRIRSLLAAALVLGGLPPTGLTGQDFMFGPPRGSIAFHMGMTFPRASSDIFDYTTEQLTLDRSDFNAPAYGGSVSLWLDPRLDALLSVGYSRSSEWSEFRDWVDQNDLPIEQKTELERVALTLEGRVYLVPRGRQVGRLAWIPHRVAPYVGAGLGWMHYTFLQEGDFVDFQDLAIFSDVFESRGWAPTVHGTAGVDVRVATRASVVLEGRYSYGSATMDRETFVGFDGIDLSGFQTTLGLRWRF